MPPLLELFAARGAERRTTSTRRSRRSPTACASRRSRGAARAVADARAGTSCSRRSASSPRWPRSIAVLLVDLVARARARRSPSSDAPAPHRVAAAARAPGLIPRALVVPAPQPRSARSRPRTCGTSRATRAGARRSSARWSSRRSRSSRRSARAPTRPTSTTLLALVAVLPAAGLTLNQFGLDGAALWSTVAAGNDPRADLTGKNLASMLVMIPLATGGDRSCAPRSRTVGRTCRSRSASRPRSSACCSASAT